MIKLKGILKEEKDWTGRDLIDLKKNLILDQKSCLGAIRNVEKLENQLASLKDKPQGKTLYSMTPQKSDTKKIKSVLVKLDKLEKGLFLIFSKAWDSIKKK